MRLTTPEQKSLGRYWGSANVATLTEFPEGDAHILLEWDDGAHVSFYEETHQFARECLKRLGFLE